MRLQEAKIPGLVGAGLTCLLAILSLQSWAEPQDPKPVLRLQTSAGEITCLGFSRNGEVFFAGTLDSWAFFWEGGDWRTILTLTPAPPPKAKAGEHQPEYRESTACAISPDGKSFVLASAGSLSVYALPSGERLRDIRFPADAVAYSPDGRLLASGYRTTVQLWETGTWRMGAKWHLPESRGGASVSRAAISSLVFSPKGDLLAFATDKGTVATLKIGSTDSPHFLSAPDNGLNQHTETVTFSTDGHFLASGSWGRHPDENTVRVWEIGSGQQAAELGGHKDNLWAIAFSSDSRHLASGDVSGLVRIWDTVSWKQECTIQADGLYVIAYSPDSKWLVTGGGDQKISIWKNPVCP